MKNNNKFAAAALAFAIASVTAGCSAPSAITIGNNTKTAMTVEDYDVAAGIFINLEIDEYKNAMYQVAMANGSIPDFDAMKNARVEDMAAEDWIQDKATQDTIEFVMVEKEFDKIGESLTDEEKAEITDALKAITDEEKKRLNENGIAEESLKKVWENNFKRLHLFNYYYGIDKERGCSEDDLKKYYKENTVRYKFVEFKKTDDDGNALSDDDIRDLNKKIDGYITEINAESDNLKKMQKLDEIKEDYNEYLESKVTTTSGQTTETTTTTTTSTTAVQTDKDGSTIPTTTTTTDPYANEIIAPRSTTSAAEQNTAPTTTEAETDSQKASKALSEKLFGDMPVYKAEKYDYDKDTIYILIKGDIEDRMTEDDIWSEDGVDSILQRRYAADYRKWMDDVSAGYKYTKNEKVYKKFAPFNLNLENVSLY